MTSPSSEGAGRPVMDAANRLGTEPVGKLLLKFSLPAISGMLVNALYNVVDRIFVGQGVGEEALGGTSLIMPLMTLGMAVAMLVGVGAANLISMRLGQGKREEAENALNHSFWLLAALGGLLTTLGLLFLDHLLAFLWPVSEGGVESPVVGYARDYFRIILYGMVFAQVSFGFSHCTRAQGFPTISMIGSFIGAGINTILDPLFIFGFGWGVKGAALATIISQAVSMCFLVTFSAHSRRAVVRLRFTSFKPSAKMALTIFTFGSSQCLLQLAMSLVQFVNNTTIHLYGADSLGVANGADVALSALNIVGSTIMLCLMPVFGINQGAQPVLGFNYGAKKWDRVFQAFFRAMLAASALTTAGFILMQVFTVPIIRLFTREGSDALMRFAPWAMRIQVLMLPLVGAQVVGTNMFVVTGRPKISIFLSLLRQVIVLLPCIMLFGKLWGLWGLVFAIPVADAVAIVITAILVTRELRRLRRLAADSGA